MAYLMFKIYFALNFLNKYVVGIVAKTIDSEYGNFEELGLLLSIID